jgi:hypothetical protein
VNDEQQIELAGRRRGGEGRDAAGGPGEGFAPEEVGVSKATHISKEKTKGHKHENANENKSV